MTTIAATVHLMSVVQTAALSDCKRYRLALGRVWDSSKPICMFIGLNPSTADHLVDDPTIRREVGYAKSWGFGGLLKGNLFALRATQPADMMRHDSPIGPGNDRHLLDMSKRADKIICAWGNDGGYKGRHSEVIKLLAGFDLYSLKVTAKGMPSHPRYLSKGLVPLLWQRSSHYGT